MRNFKRILIIKLFHIKKKKFILNIDPYDPKEEVGTSLSIDVKVFDQYWPENHLIVEDIVFTSEQSVSSEKNLFRVKKKTKGTEYSLKLCSFDSYDSYEFKELLYYMHVLTEVRRKLIG